ncbi:MAG: hypothetical protein ACE5F1_05300 [Planctomycetota bacterium]
MNGKGFDRRRTLGLLGVSVLVVVAVFYTRESSHQVLVEARADSIRKIAEREQVTPELLLALCVAEAHREEPRSDAAVAKLLAEALEGSGGAVKDAVHSLFEDGVVARMTLDLWARNRERWQRIVGASGSRR